MKKRISYRMICLLLLIICQANLSAQIGPIKNTVIPPSPTSAVFRQFTGYTPNLSTGSVNVPISLYDVNVGNCNIPISLQYYTSGIKFTDDPYPAGYGWILSPGLRITRTIMGRPDMYYPMDVRQTPSDVEYLKKAMYDADKGTHTGWWRGTLLDTQHDIFTVHLPQGDYTFFIKKVGTEYVAVTANNLLKITPTSAASFEVTDENGVVYYFGEESASSPLSPYTERYNDYFTSWMLRKVVLPGSGREINLTWQHVRHAKLRFGPYFGGDILKDYKARYSANIPEDINPSYTSAEQTGLLVEYGEYTNVSQLKQISFPSGVVQFTYRAVDNPLITNITVKNTNNAVVKTVDFAYGTGLDERLLKSITQSDEGTYQFEYHTKRFHDGNKNSQDYWGYYNEKSNLSLVPRMQIKTYNNRDNANANYVYYGTADRSVNSEAMKAYMLTKVIYPTGGYSAFEYEPHRFQGSVPTTEGLGSVSKQALTQGGGLRITKVTTVAGNGAPEIVKTYKYGVNENGLAHVLYEPTLDTFIDECNGFDGDISGSFVMGYNLRILFLNTQSNYMRYAINTPALWYGTVTEYVNNENKTMYNFNRHILENTFTTTWVKDFPTKGITRYSNLFSKGCLLTKETQYLKSGSTYTPLKQTSYNYTARYPWLVTVNNLFVNRNCVNLLSDGPDFEIINGIYYSNGCRLLGYAPELEYTSNNYVIEDAYEELTSQETTHYNSGGNITESVGYTYANKQLRSKTILKSDGTTQTEQYLYPADYTQAGTQAQRTILLNMLNKNMQSAPYQITKTVNSNIELARTEFKDFGNYLYLPEKEYSKKGNNPEVCTSTYDYDTKANLRSVTKDGTFKNTYLWGYNDSYPVAVIEGLSYAEVLNIVGQTNINSLNNYTYAPSTLNTIRNQLNGRGLVTSYTYEPLIGVSSMTTPNGWTTYYTYDRVGRLKKIEDKDRKKLQHFAYHRIDDSAIQVAFTTPSSYSQGTNASVTATVSGGSEWYNYVWTLKNSGGTVIYTSAASESATVSIPLQQSGSMTLTCTVTDKMTGETQSYSRTFTVSNPTINFTNVSKSGNTVTARITCSQSCRVHFYLNAEMNGGTANYSLAGQNYTLNWADGQSVSITLPSGTHTFSISLTNSYGGEKASLQITGLDSTHTIGSPSYIEIYN